MKHSFARLLRLFSLLMISALTFGAVLSPLAVRRARADDNPARCLASENVEGCKHGLPAATYDQLLAHMQAYPAPEVGAIEVDKKEVGAYSFWKVLANAEIYSAPNGSVIGKMDEGFTFVVVYKTQGDFAQLKNGTWVRRDSLKRTFASNLSGVLTNNPLRFPMAWVIQASIPASIPGGPIKSDRPAIKRYTQVNIYATVRVGNWDYYLVGPGQWLDQRKVGRIVQATKPAEAGEKWVAVDLFEQVLTAYEGDKMIFGTLISSGLTQWQTNKGTFKVWSRVRSTAMSGSMGQPDFYSLPAVPYVMYFDNDISLHGTYWHDGFGYKRSHGCVNMTISDARWLYNWMGDGELTVLVWDSRAAK
jgi:lipoprotein-anchoring transpeptidase ErfK/SrfK